SACVSPASIRAARIWRPETMLLITELYTILQTPPPVIPLCSRPRMPQLLSLAAVEHGTAGGQAPVTPPAWADADAVRANIISTAICFIPVRSKPQSVLFHGRFRR